VQSLGCAPEVELLGNREEGSQLGNIHLLKVSPDEQ
jgi:hypothetical protein